MNNYRSIKVVLVGDMYVGKTSLANVFTSSTFQDKYSASVGGHFQAKNLPELNVTVQLWDTAGMERFRALLPHFMRDAMCALMVYDVSNKETFVSVQNYWLEYVESHAIPNLVKVLVANKADVQLRAVKENEGRRFASLHNMLFVETSAKFGLNVNLLFSEAAKAVTKAFPPVQVEKNGIQLEKLGYKKEKRCCLMSS
ncbi:ras-related protein Rab-18-B-like [Physella acuta]|uniref:ras-related protein Rab-18-B-like n=1 Tax=Physella acuta TaxID=109671 RepID=UPI0027DE617E|nr:ras-related protein Rab-18-B-like [Physella acuta]XP_059141279.1 ras-related protein Rab-18-B-like [Physella acuta]XP_059141280.1 ras-related protein Rab-18-B-like [Physella acuta]